MIRIATIVLTLSFLGGCASSTQYGNHHSSRDYVNTMVQVVRITPQDQAATELKAMSRQELKTFIIENAEPICSQLATEKNGAEVTKLLTALELPSSEHATHKGVLQRITNRNTSEGAFAEEILTYYGKQ
ncbi:hypothetical protein FHR99_002467 [Litorivivens lipolytica]|uniref:Lipoprotein n=1 Tax=Litorivivens lipolytica TaxID=1524264 RepID=A0A7W4W6Y6_9GAMM|nr:hypothetical protein [Litorivivens lipolytica]MBB3048193.1 hypothetical protein [Litorivivens lipolytica]